MFSTGRPIEYCALPGRVGGNAMKAHASHAESFKEVLPMLHAVGISGSCCLIRANNRLRPNKANFSEGVKMSDHCSDLCAQISSTFVFDS
jgi:hypothetical protein